MKLIVADIVLTSGMMAAIALMAGCGLQQSISGSGRPPGGLDLPAGNSPVWVSQLDHQTPPPSFVPGDSGSVLNTVWSIATDSQGNAVIGGYNGAEFPQATNFRWDHEAFVAKYDRSGNLLWLQQFGNDNGTPAYDDVISVFTDSQGNVYAGGTTYGAFPGYSNPRNELELMLAKFSADGTLLWVQQYPTDVIFSTLIGVTPTTNGNIAFAGTALGETTGSGDNTFVKVINPSTAALVWEKTYPGDNDLIGFTADPAGDLVGVGTSLGAFPGSGTGSGQPFVIKWDANSGGILWTQQFADYLAKNEVTLGTSTVAVDPTGAVIVAGATAGSGGSLCQGLCTLPSVSDQGVFIAKIDGSSGGVDWIKTVSTGKGDGATGVASDAAGGIVVVGFTNGQMSDSFSQPLQDLFALKLDATGAVVSVEQFGAGPWIQGSLPDQGAQVAVGPSGNFYVSAETQGAFPGYSNSTNISQVFVAGFGP